MSSVRIITTAQFLRTLGKRPCVSRPPRLIGGVSSMLGARRGAVVSWTEIADWVYGDDKNGGPLFMREAIRDTIFLLRHRYGAPIESVSNRGYRLLERAA